jgi:hypothetical protein
VTDPPQGHLVDRETLENYRTALDSGRRHGPWTRATCAAVLRTLDATEAERDRLREAIGSADVYLYRHGNAKDPGVKGARDILNSALEEK